ncbi:hypothetical protein CXT76_02075 [Candidatus Parvarchaeota archaeon]|nr:MAG: hypothetical protein CXT76_02075 [Candidatus Parvarchaeota archaeon]
MSKSKMPKKLKKIKKIPPKVKKIKPIEKKEEKENLEEKLIDAGFDELDKKAIEIEINSLQEDKYKKREFIHTQEPEEEREVKDFDKEKINYESKQSYESKPSYESSQNERDYSSPKDRGNEFDEEKNYATTIKETEEELEDKKRRIKRF